MKKPLPTLNVTTGRFNYTQFLSSFALLLMILTSGLSFGQQVIGSFPYMNGGFEGQSAGALGTTISSSLWTRQSQAGATSSIVTTSPRSGVNYASVTNVTTVSRGLQTPQGSTGGPTASTSYVVQFFVKNSSTVTSFQAGITTNGTSNTTYSTASTLGINALWTLQSYVLSTTATAVASNGLGIAGRSAAGSFDVDDFVIYPGNAIDVTAPASAGTVTVNGATTTSLNVGWAAAATVDGGGYVVVRYATNPNTDNDPNQNGIYAVGNTTTNGTGALVGTVVYTGTGLSFTDSGLSSNSTYYYKVYTVDKAFNYAAEVSGNGTTSAASGPSITTSLTMAAVNTTYGTASATPTSFSFTGSNLTANVVVNAPSGFEISQTGAAGSYAMTQEVTQTAGSIGSTTIHVRLAATTNAGTYSGNVTFSPKTPGTDNLFGFTIATASSTVSKKGLTIDPPTIASKVFDKTTASGTVTPAANSTIVGLIGSQTVTVNTASGVYADANVGGTKTATITYTLNDGTNGGLAANYDLTGTSTGAITARPISFSSASTIASKVYNGTAAAGAVTVGTLSNLVAAGDVTVTGVANTYPSANEGSYTGTTIVYTIVTGTVAATNYSIVDGSATAAITPRPLSITAPTIAARDYDDITTTAGVVTTGTLSNLVAAGDVTVTAVAADYPSVNAGSYAGTVVTYNVVTGNVSASNYSLANGSATGVINPKALSITTPSVATKTYNGLTTSGTVTSGTLSGFVNGKVVSVATATGTYTTAAVGTGKTATIVYTLASGTGLAANYSLANGSATGDITAATLTVTASTATKTFSATLNSGTGKTAFTSVGLQNSETIGSVTITYGTGAAAGDAIGTYPNQAVPTLATGGTFAASNYSIAYVSGAILVVAAPVVIGGGATITCPATPTATYTTPPTGVTFSNWSRGSGVTCASLSTGLNGSGFTTTPGDYANAYIANKYYSITITANSTTAFNLSNITWDTSVSGGTADYTMMYSNNGGTATTFGATAQAFSSTVAFSGSVNVAPGTSIVLYFIPTNTTGGTVRLLNGSTITVTSTTLATVTTASTPSVVGTTTATLGGNVTATGGGTITANGVVYVAGSGTPSIGGGAVVNLSNGSPATGTGAFTVDTVAALAVNSQYSYRSYATNIAGTSYGGASGTSFYTLGNVPAAPTVDNAGNTTLDVTVNVNSNPASTEFAIYETTTNQYVEQATGALGASADWKTASGWGVGNKIQVTGLASNTTYTFKVKARNGANVETLLNTTGTSGTTLTPSTPTISTSGTLTAVNTTYGTASATPTSFTVSGSALTDNIVITPPSGFEISKTVGGASGYATSQTLPQSGGIVATTTIYVRLAATTAFGTYSDNIHLVSTADGLDITVATVSSSVAKKTLTLTGLSVTTPKIYDGTTTAVVTGTAALQSSVAAGSGTISDGKPISGDDVGVTGTATGTYNFKDVATATTVNYGGITLTGALTSGNYILDQGTAPATITAKALTVSGISATTTKTYNNSTAAVVSGTAALAAAEAVGTGTTADGTPYLGDTVSLSGTATATYNSKDVLTATTITYGGLVLAGGQAGNYSLTLPSPISGSITKADQTITFPAFGAKTTASAPFAGGASTDALDALTISYSSATTTVATVSGTTITIAGVGTSIITASQAGNGNYNAAVSVDRTLTVTQVPVVWNFGTSSSNASPSSGTPITGLTISAISQGNPNGTPTLLATTSQSDYSGASAAYNAGTAIVSGALNTATSSYFEFTITPNASYTATIAGISFGSRGTSVGPVNYSVRTSYDNYANDIATGTLVTTSTWVFYTPATTTVTSQVGTPLIVRIYGYSGTGGATTVNWRLDDLTVNVTSLLQSDPYLSTGAVTSLSNFGSVNVGSNSSSSSFTLTGGQLSPASGSITANASANFEVSSDNSTFGSSISTFNYSGSAINTPVYVRFKPTSDGAKTGTITFTGGGVTVSPSISVSGTGTLASPIASAATSITNNSFIANWNTLTGAASYSLDVSTASNFVAAATTNLVSESFENTAPTFSTISGGSFSNGTSSFPGTSYASVGSYGYIVSGSTATLTTGNINTSGWGSLQLSLRVMAAAGTSGNGMDATGDQARVAISTDGGTSYTDYVTLTGASANNSYWSYAGTGLASTSYGTPATFAAPITASNPAGYSTVNITNLPSISNLRVRITLVNDSANETWAIDDFKITGNAPSLETYSITAPTISKSVTTYNSSALTSNTNYYYRVSAVGPNSGTSGTSGTITVKTCSSAPTVTTPISYCLNSTPSQLSVTASGTLKWYADATTTIFTTTAPTPSTSAIGTTSYYVTQTESGTCESPRAKIDVVVNDLPTASILYAGSPYCATGSATVTQGGQTGGTYSSTAGLSINSTTGAINLGTSTAGTYNVTYSFSNGTCSNTTTASVTINALPTATISNSASSVCQTGTAPTITFTGTGGTAPYTFSYNINGGATQTVTSGSGSNPVSVTVSVPLTTAGTYTYNLTNVSGQNCSQVQTGTATITITPTPDGTLTNGGAVCAGTQPQLTFTSSAGTGPFALVINGQTYNNIASGVAFTAFGTAPTVNTVYTLTSVTGLYCTNPSPTASTSVTVTQSPTYGNLQSPASGSICQKGTFDAYGQVYQFGVTEAAGAGSGIEAQFGYSNSNSDPSTWTNWNTASFNVQSGNNDEYKYTFTPPSTGTYYYSFRYRQGTCGWIYGGYSGSGGGIWNGTTNVNGSLLVSPTVVSGTASADQTLCYGTPPADLTLSGSTGSIQWQISADNLTFNNINGQTSSTLTGSIIGNLTQTTYYRALVTSGNCPSANSNTVVISVRSAIGYANLQYPGTANFCSGGNFTAYGQIYQAEVTPGAGAGSGLTVEFGYNTADTNPSGWSNWSTATYNTDNGNNDEYQYTFTPPSSGMYYYAFRYKTGNCNWVYGGYTSSGGGFWDGTTNVSGVLNVTPPVNAGTVSGASPLFIGQTATYSTNGTSGGTWSSTNTSVATVNGSTGLVTANAAGSADIIYTINSGCGSPVSAFKTLTVTDVTTWDGTSWDHGVPTLTVKAAISGSYDTSTKGNFSALNLRVNSGGSLLITQDNVITLENELINNGSVLIDSDGSLIQKSDSPPVANSGSIDAIRSIKINGNKEYNYLISPLIGSNLKNNIYGPGNSAPLTLYYNEANNNFYNSIGTYIVGRGLAVKEPSTGSGTINALFKGVPMNGSFTYPLANSGTAATGYNLTGNPYPSNINIIALYHLGSNATNISPDFYFWDNTANTVYEQGGSSYNGAAYAVFNAVSGMGNGAGFLLNPSIQVASKKPTEIVKVGQGFIVRSIETTNKTLTFNNDIRVSDVGNGYFGNPSKASTGNLSNRFWVNLTAPTNMTTQIGVVYFDAGNNNFAIEDSELHGFPSDILYSLIGDKKAVINGRSTFVNTDRISLGSNNFAAGNYTFSLGNHEGLFAKSQNIYLKDNRAGIITNLSEGSYTFTANAGESTGRFEIIYLPETPLATDEVVKSQVSVYRDGSDFVVKATELVTHLQVYDISGRMLQELKPNALETRIDGNKLPDGVYILKIEGKTLKATKKIIK